MNSSKPRIAVLMPAHNAEKTIDRALNSLKANTEPHDIVIVDDGSEFPLTKILPEQKNLIILRMEKNVGIAAALNVGVNYILEKNYELLARFDADDICHANRLIIQREFLDNSPSIGMVGSWGRYVSEEGEEIFHLNHPTDHKTITKKLYYNSQFIHPTVMIRTSVLRQAGGYSENYPSAEDYEFVRRISRLTQTANIPAYLIDYTVSKGGISISKRRQQLLMRLKAQLDMFEPLCVHSYFGVLKTLSLMLVPNNLITAIKKRKAAYRPI